MIMLCSILWKIGAKGVYIALGMTTPIVEASKELRSKEERTRAGAALCCTHTHFMKRNQNTYLLQHDTSTREKAKLHNNLALWEEIDGSKRETQRKG